MLCKALESFSLPKCVSIRAAGLVAVGIELDLQNSISSPTSTYSFWLAAICYETYAFALV